jgi:hypothetical protein
MKHKTLLLLLFVSAACAADWKNLFNGRNLDGWQTVGDGVWTMMRDGTVLGQRDFDKAVHQAWLYTDKEFTNFDLEFEYWTRYHGNSGISIRDSSRGKWAVGAEADSKKTPSHIGYEIQIIHGLKNPAGYASGSVYLFDHAKTGFEIDNDWNRMLVESRPEMIRVSINGHVVSQHAGDPARPKTGPIGLQLHDKNSVVMFRKVRIRELGK